MPGAAYIPGARPRRVVAEEQPPGYEDSEGQRAGGVGWPYRECGYAGGVRGFCAHCGGVVLVWGRTGGGGGGGGSGKVEIEMGSLDAPGEVFGCLSDWGRGVRACCNKRDERAVWILNEGE